MAPAATTLYAENRRSGLSLSSRLMMGPNQVASHARPSDEYFDINEYKWGVMMNSLVLTALLTLGLIQPALGANTLKHRLPKKPGFSILSHQPGNCPDSGDPTRCEIPVLAFPPDSSHGKCWVQFFFSPMTIANGATPKVVWILAKGDPDDGSKYRFKPNGIDLLTTSGVANDPNLDFADPDFDVSLKHRYKWRSVNARPSSFDYQINVIRKPPGGSWAHPEDCTPTDPTINNNGP
jgi:hypothetical protein